MSEAPTSAPAPSGDAGRAETTDEAAAPLALRAVAVALALLLGATLTAFATRYAGHGLHARYEAPEAAPDRVIHETVEHRAQFPNPYRAWSRVVEHWDYDAFGVPPEMPHLRITLRGTLRIPDGGTKRVRLRPAGRRGRGRHAATVQLAGTPLTSTPRELSAGTHPLAATWEGRLPRGQHLMFEWAEEEGRFEAVPLAWFDPPPDAASGSGLVLALGILLTLAFGLSLWWASGGDRPARRRRLGRVAFALIFALGLFLRLWDYAVMPEFHENGDELFATWNGHSLLGEGTTRGWSLWPGTYGDRVAHEELPYWDENGRAWHIITPYFEHPPLLHLMVGAAAHLGGAEHYAHSRLSHTRLVPIGLAMVTLWLIFAIGRNLFPAGPSAWFAALLWAVHPATVIQTRVIKEEALLVPMALAGVLVFLRYRAGLASRRALLIAGFSTGLLAMVKVSGAFFLPALVLLVFRHAGLRRALEVCAAGALGVSMLFLYGALIDWDAFWFSTQHQATGRPIHWNVFARWFSVSLVNHNRVGFGQQAFLWLAYVGAVLGAGRKPKAVLVLPPMLYLSAMTVAAGNWTFGWYLLPVLPFLYLGAGRFLADLWETPELLRAMLFFGLFVMYGLNFTISPEWAHEAPSWPILRRWVTVFVGVLFVPFIVAQVLEHRWTRAAARLAMAAGLALAIGLSAHFVLRYESIFSTHAQFDLDRHFTH